MHVRCSSGVVAVAAIAFGMLLSSESVAQEIQITGPLSCAPALVCRPTHREGRVALTLGALTDIGGDGAGPRILGDATVRFFGTERIGFGLFAAHRLADGSRGSRLRWATAPEVALVIARTKYYAALPIDWHASFGPALAVIDGSDATSARTRTRAAVTAGTGISLVGALLASIDLRLLTAAPANVYLGVSIGYGHPVRHACADLSADCVSAD